MSTIMLSRTRTNRPLPRDRQELHAALAAATAGSPRALWATPTRHLLIAQAERIHPDALPAGDTTVTHLHPTWQAGQHVELSLIANPTQAAWRPGARGVRRPLPEPEWAGWLSRKVTDAVTLHDVAAEALGNHAGRRRGGTVTHQLVAFTATGTVTDPDALTALQVAGIGSGKAYGAGLLLVRPLEELAA